MNNQMHILIAKFSFTLPYDIDMKSYSDQIALDLINQIGFRDKWKRVYQIRKELIHQRTDGLNRYSAHYLISMRFDPDNFDTIHYLIEQSIDKLFEQCLIQSRDIIIGILQNM